ncbi:nucleotidyltransferase family protein [Deinococcus oregonensis]|uniref:Nucleotidyltransferase family protein n=1 Tax=Deinococcus oregonensis TaxID=1805970 RepID=A0ABV6B256_9DEIO
MTDPEFLHLIRLNPVNAAILNRLPQVEAFAPQVHLVAGALFQTVWNMRSGQAPQTGIRDYDLFYWHPDTSYEAEDAVIHQTADLFDDLDVRIEVRNQARVHLWFREKYGLTRPPLTSARDGVLQFLVKCTCVGIDAAGDLYAPYGLHDLAAGVLRRNPLNHTPELYAAKADDYRQRWPWLREAGPQPE